VSGYIEIQSGVSTSATPVLHQQITSQKLQQWLLQIWTPFQQHSNLAIDRETSGDDGPSIRISMLPWASCKGIAKQRTPGEAAVTLELSMGLAVSTLLKMTLYW